MTVPLMPRLAVLLLLVLQAAAVKPSESPEIYSRVREYTVTYTIAPDATFTEQRKWARTVLDEKAIPWMKEASITYSTSMQTAEVLAAYTRKADGRRIDVPPGNFQIVARGGRQAASPAYSDWTTMSVIFSDVAVGDTVVLAYRLVAKQPLFPGHFSATESFPRVEAYDDVRIQVDMPASLAARHEGRFLKEVRNVEKDGRRILEWSWANAAPAADKRRDYSVYDVDAEPGYSISTFPSYAAIAEAYGARAREKAVVTDRIRKLAEEISPGNHAPVDVARRLYDWVATNITYAGNCIGLGAAVPRDLAFVLDNRMGDCKDHATLLQALLAAKGIASTQALVNARSSYRLSRVPVVSMVNHVINYIPSLDLYLDSTSASTPFGMLPFSVADKPALLVDGYRDGTRTPVAPIGTNRQTMTTELTINEDGSIKGNVSITLGGSYAATARERFRALPKEQKAQFVSNVFRSMGLNGTGSFDHDDPKPLLDTFSYRASFEVKSVVAFPGTGAFPIAPFFYNEAPVSQYASHAFLQVEQTDVACSSGRTSEEYIFHLPKGMKILALPPNVKMDNGFLSYRSDHVREGDELRVQREFDDRTKGNVCKPGVMQQYKDFAEKILPSLKSQVVYQ